MTISSVVPTFSRPVLLPCLVARLPLPFVTVVGTVPVRPATARVDEDEPEPTVAGGPSSLAPRFLFDPAPPCPVAVDDAAPFRIGLSSSSDISITSADAGVVVVDDDGPTAPREIVETGRAGGLERVDVMETVVVVLLGFAELFREVEPAAALFVVRGVDDDDGAVDLGAGGGLFMA